MGDSTTPVRRRLTAMAAAIALLTGLLLAGLGAPATAATLPPPPADESWLAELN